jgi:hypothetical protein
MNILDLSTVIYLLLVLKTFQWKNNIHNIFGFKLALLEYGL